MILIGVVNLFSGVFFRFKRNLWRAAKNKKNKNILICRNIIPKLLPPCVLRLNMIINKMNNKYGRVKTKLLSKNGKIN